MNTEPLTRVVTKTIVLGIFWIVFLIRLFLEDWNELELNDILINLVIALFAAAAAWVFLLILNDSLVKSMVQTAKEKQVDRYKGGLSYHLKEPSREEKAWQRKNADELSDSDKNKKA